MATLVKYIWTKIIIFINSYLDTICYLLSFKMIFSNYVFLKKTKNFLILTFFSKFDLEIFLFIWFIINWKYKIVFSFEILKIYLKFNNLLSKVYVDLKTLINRKIEFLKYILDIFKQNYWFNLKNEFISFWTYLLLISFDIYIKKTDLIMFFYFNIIEN